ncbi:Gfo/Idh/MocA family protein [Kineococcus sp. SYSU DK004]|uniref:Gfo/Idh/MocA family protein n=1 Tax=Kineococcus sp. SYSU DK004 TaxID=3383125 RepID=UPI003D7C960D
MTVPVVHVGLGGWGGDWERNAIPPVREVRRTAVVDPHEPTLRAAQEALELPDEVCFTTLADALAAVECEGVLLTTPVTTHVPLALQALEAGKHVLVEKPFASTAEEAATAVRRAEELGLVLQVSQNYRAYPAPRAVRRLLAEGALGRVGAIDVDFRKWDNDAPADTYGHYRFPHPLLHDMAIHHFDALRQVTGQEAVRVHAVASNPPFSNYREPAAAVVTVEMSDGVVVSYRGSWVSRGADTPWGGEWNITGELGSISFATRSGGEDALEGDVVVLHPAGGEPDVVPLEPMPVWGRSAGLQQFAAAVRGGPAPDVTGRDNLGSVALMEAATESARTGRPVDVVVPR